MPREQQEALFEIIKDSLVLKAFFVAGDGDEENIKLSHQIVFQLVEVLWQTEIRRAGKEN